MQEHGLDEPLEIGPIRYQPLDELGRAQGIVAELRPGELVGGSSAYHEPHGYEGRRENHAQGHLLGKQLGGAGADPRNIALLYQDGANTPDMSRLEGAIRRAVDGGETVTYEVMAIYDGDNHLPMGVRLTAKGDNGFHLTADVRNVSRPARAEAEAKTAGRAGRPGVRARRVGPGARSPARAEAPLSRPGARARPARAAVGAGPRCSSSCHADAFSGLRWNSMSSST